MTALVLAYLAGVLTTLNPCVLPMLPIVIAGTLAGGRFGPLAFAGGMVVSFTAVGLFIASIGIGLGITPEVLRNVAATLFIAFGLILVVKPLQDRFALATAGLANGANTLAARVTVAGPAGPALIGALAGAIWSPCAGPSLGAAIALAAEAGGLGPAALRMLAFGVGAASILMALAYGSRAALARRKAAFLELSAGAKTIGGAVFLLAGLAVLSGWDKVLEAALVTRMPDWLIGLTTGL